MMVRAGFTAALDGNAAPEPFFPAFFPRLRQCGQLFPSTVIVETLGWRLTRR